jgi:uncharacterized protein
MSAWAAAAGGAVGLAFLLMMSRLWPAPAWPRATIARDGWGRAFFAGLGAGLGVMAAIELTLAVAGMARIMPAPRQPAFGWSLIWALTALLVAAAQEGWVRGWLLANLAERWGFRRAAIATSGLFVILHAEPGVLILPPGLILLGACGLFLFGLVAAASVRASGSIAWAVGAHVGWDYVQGFVLGAPAYGQSPAAGSLLLVEPHGSWAWFAGAAFGPEASPLSLLVLGAGLWAWLRVRPPRGQGSESGLTSGGAES